jgi:predicted aconitase
VNLSEDEKRMMEGDMGDVIQKAIKFLVKVGESLGAEELVDITSSHLLTIMNTKDAIYKLNCDLMRGAKAKVCTTTHALPFDPEKLGSMGLPESIVAEASNTIPQIYQLYRAFGALPTYTCLPYSYYFFRLGEHVAFTDSQVVPLVNSWFGVQTNMETPASAIASAITGKTPKYGMHLKENRLGDILIDIAPELKAEEFDCADYAALSFWAGKIRLDGLPATPVYRGLSPKTTIGAAKNMALSHTWQSGATIFHMVGITPEAPTVEAAFGGRRPKARFTFGGRERDEAYQGLTSATEKKVDVVCLGCPHCTIEELQDIARLLDGKEVNKDTKLWIGTSRVTKDLAKRIGLVDIIEQAGGIVISDACVTFNPVIALGARVVATNAGALFMLPVITKGRALVWFGTTVDCVKAAIKGNWEV